MKFNLVNRLLQKFERSITISGKSRLKDFFQGYSVMHKRRSDAPEIIRLIEKHNSKIKEYNELGEALAFLLWHKWDELNPKVQSDFLGVVDEWLRMRSINRKKEYFGRIDQRMHTLERKMNQLIAEKDGIIHQRTQIEKLRKR